MLDDDLTKIWNHNWCLNFRHLENSEHWAFNLSTYLIQVTTLFKVNKFSSAFYVQFYLPKDQSVNMFLLDETTGLNFLCIFLNCINLYSNNHSLNLFHKLLFIQMYSIWKMLIQHWSYRKCCLIWNWALFPWIISNYDNKIPWFSWKLCLLCWTCCIYFSALLVSMAIKIMYKMETSLVS